MNTIQTLLSDFDINIRDDRQTTLNEFGVLRDYCSTTTCRTFYNVVFKTSCGDIIHRTWIQKFAPITTCNFEVRS